MANKQPKPDIDRIFADGRLIDEAMRESVQKAFLEHKRAGNPIATMKDGKVVLVNPEVIST